MENINIDVHNSNMSKLWTEEEVNSIRGDLNYSYKKIFNNTNKCFVVKKSSGKVMKSPSYTPANPKKYIQS